MATRAGFAVERPMARLYDGGLTGRITEDSLRILRALTWVLLFVPAVATGQSTLNFPRSFSPEDLALSGFAVVNPADATAPATFTLFGSDGSTVATFSEDILAGGQLSLLGTELFPNASADGWVQVTSPADGLQGFWLGGDFTTFTDGAEAAPSATGLVFPLVAEDTEINVVNTAGTPSEVTISLRQAEGTELATRDETISGMGVFKDQASAVFPEADLSEATHIQLSATTAISATAIVDGFLVSPSWGVVNGVDASATTTELNFAHVITGDGGGGNWLTQVGVTNLTASSNFITITFNPLEGSPVTVQRTIAANGGLRESTETLFGFPATEFQNGWVQVTSTAPTTGFVAYADAVAGGLAIVPVQNMPLTQMLFAHIAQATGWLTGIALLNTSNTAAEVEVFAITPNGTLIGGVLDSPDAAFTLAPGAKIARLLDDPWIPAAKTNGGFVFVRTANDVPLYGIELFFLTNLALLSNVSPGALAPGIDYTPPTPAGTITLDSVTPTTVSRGGTLTLDGSGFSETPTSNTIVFSTASGTTSVAADSATPTTLTATVPSDAVSGPLHVEIGSTSSGSEIVEVTASGTELLQTTVTVTGGQTTTGVDIYVPEPAATLNITAIGVGDRDESIFFAASSVELSRGQTTDLLVSGAGISEANGTTLTFSGSGLVISNVHYFSNRMTVQIAVDASAALGPRTVIVTNANLDTSVLSGGVIIRD